MASVAAQMAEKFAKMRSPLGKLHKKCIYESWVKTYTSAKLYLNEKGYYGWCLKYSEFEKKFVTDKIIETQTFHWKNRLWTNICKIHIIVNVAFQGLLYISLDLKYTEEH